MLTYKHVSYFGKERLEYCYTPPRPSTHLGAMLEVANDKKAYYQVMDYSRARGFFTEWRFMPPPETLRRVV